MLTALALSLIALSPAPPQEAAGASTASVVPLLEWRTFEADGVALRYAIQWPLPAEPEVRPPVLLALPPGSQDEGLVRLGLELYWAREAARRGWIVVSPAAPEGASLHAGASDALLALAASLVLELAPEGGRLHLAGVSNGGRSAFHFAQRAPQLWHTLTAAPGVPAEDGDLGALLHLPIALFGGADDAGWAAGMRAARERLVELGAVHVDLELFEGEGHVPASLEGGLRLFERLEEHRALALERVAEEEAVRALLDDFHDAASMADGERYFAHFAPGATFLGTDASEHWSLDAFRDYATPYFDRGQGWTYVATERHVALSVRGDVAWFDERLQNEKYGETRGSGVLVQRGGRWRLRQYVLSLPVPNELAGDLVERIRGLGR